MVKVIETRRGVRGAAAMAGALVLLLAGGAAAKDAPSARRGSGAGRAPVETVTAASLGRDLFFDTSLSEPAGQGCVSCHAPEAGFTFPISGINELFGVAPGAVAGRFGFRAVPSVSYAAFNPPGPPHHNHQLLLYVGGQFWDGHANDLADQATFPFINPNEMNNMTHNMGDPALVVQKVAAGPLAEKFRQIFGDDAFLQPTEVVYGQIAEAISEYEKTDEVSPFSSKYDAWRAGKAEFTESELNGLRLVTGSWSGRPDGAAYFKTAHCVECHIIPTVPSAGPDIWTSTCYQNIGVPRNAGNPFYTQTDALSNPAGYNPDGAEFVDIGLGNTLYPLYGFPPGNMGPGSDGSGDFLGINGLFKAPSFRNVDKRPNPAFVKAYMHNGALKSVEQVVHFYNTRNLTTKPFEVIDFTRDDPYAGLEGTPLWPAPESPSPVTLLNAEGLPGTDPGMGPGGESFAQVGNLQLTADEEADIVAFLKTLSDGYFVPEFDPCVSVISQPVPQKVGVGQSAKMTVAVHASVPVTFQWRHNGQPMDGETVSYYSIVAAGVQDAGDYDCVVTAECGAVTSRAAHISVCPGDLNGDGLVDDADFSVFAVAYDLLDCTDPEMPFGCPADLNTDFVVDDADFSIFAVAYDALLCD
ncbi:MAG: cytochrome c peroxidase [Phycisphaerales bacterium]|nr:hypothetical protein [Planctomycetota bacterium]